MAFDKKSNGFTFHFSIVMVVVIGTLLALVSMGLKEKQDQNALNKKRMDILGAIQVESSRDNASEIFDQYVKDAYVIDSEGKRVDGGVGAFDVDIQKDYRDNTLAETDKKFPIYVCEKDGKALYVIPMVGKGLWGPVWGFVAVENDYKTIYGVKFDHKSETPGLGAEINTAEFQDRFNKVYGKRSIDYTAKKHFEVLKGGSKPIAENQIDGITGGTITSKGVEEMIDRTFKIYGKHFQSMGTELQSSQN
jgi:Na+-transporting NADH:ubiquinone oxidoreductase subunit C